MSIGSNSLNPTSCRGLPACVSGAPHSGHWVTKWAASGEKRNRHISQQRVFAVAIGNRLSAPPACGSPGKREERLARLSVPSPYHSPPAALPASGLPASAVCRRLMAAVKPG
jgi:hypothetical protein